MVKCLNRNRSKHTQITHHQHRLSNNYTCRYWNRSSKNPSATVVRLNGSLGVRDIFGDLNEEERNTINEFFIILLLINSCYWSVWNIVRVILKPFDWSVCIVNGIYDIKAKRKTCERGNNCSSYIHTYFVVDLMSWWITYRKD